MLSSSPGFLAQKQKMATSWSDLSSMRCAMSTIGRNFHPEDELLITEAIKRERPDRESVDALQQEYLGLVADLKMDIPFFSPRYIGHILGDQLIPANVAYFASMLHNPNNATLVASPRTTRYKLELAQQLARLMGYPDSTWGISPPAAPLPTSKLSRSRAI
jgi:hypothetical protein